jgi:hypothetical protein
VLEGAVIRGLVKIDNEEPKVSDAPGGRAVQRAIYRIWPDFKIQALINRTVATVKADAARSSFSAEGDDIVWAVLDSGVDKTHPHFAGIRTSSSVPRFSIDFTVPTAPATRQRRVRARHSCEGIIAGEISQTRRTCTVTARHRTSRAKSSSIGWS